MVPSSTHADVVGAYRQKLAGIERLSPERERELARRFQAGDRRAGDALVTALLPFVVAIALEYRRWGLPVEDLVQQGNVGLLRAAAKFDPERDVRLATYAAFWIRAEIRELVVRGYRVVRIGTTKAERRAIRAYRSSEARDADSLAAVSGLTRERAVELLPVLAGAESSLDAPIGKSDDAPRAIDLVAANDPSPEDLTEADEAVRLAHAAVDRALVILSDRERLIVEERFMSDEPATLRNSVTGSVSARSAFASSRSARRRSSPASSKISATSDPTRGPRSCACSKPKT